MKFLTLTLYISIFFNIQLFALQSYQQILITKTAKKSYLNAIKHQLDLMNVKMYIKKIDSYYLIYSGKYSNEDRAKYTLLKIKRKFPSALLLKKKQDKVFNQLQNKNNFFISAAIGISEIKEDGTSYTIETGYILNENFFTSLAYLNSSTCDLGIDNIYLSFNYNYNLTKDNDLYIGLIAGYSSLQLTGYTQSSASSSTLLGLQVGSSYSFNQKLALFIAYQGINLDHKIELLEDSSSLSFHFIHNMQVGIKYKF